jgi:hypothetical protein
MTTKDQIALSKLYAENYSSEGLAEKALKYSYMIKDLPDFLEDLKQHTPIPGRLDDIFDQARKSSYELLRLWHILENNEGLPDML